MRVISAGVVIASLFVVGLASAAEGKGPGKAGGGSPGSSSSESGSTPAESGSATRTGETENGGGDDSLNPDIVNPFAPSYKPWEVGISMETHRLVYQNDLAGGDALNGPPDTGAGNNKGVNDFEAYIRYDITKHDRVSIRAYLFERFLADDGETGVRFDDLNFTYTHSFTLPRKFNLDLGFSTTAPTSYDAQLAGTVTTPRLSLSVDRRFGPLSLTLRTFAQYDIQTNSTWGTAQDGGAPTTLFHVGVVGDAELHMPFYEPLSLGIGLYDAYVWYHNIQGQLPAVTDQNFATQPVQQSYGGEAYVRYLMPTVFGFKPDVSVAYAMGDPATGYSSVLHDGVGHVYLGFRQQAEVYLALAVRY